MTRLRNDLFDDRIADWLEGDPSTAPGAVLDTVFAALPSVPQRSRRFPWPWPATSPAVRFAAATMALAVIVLSLSLLAVPIFGPPRPTPSPTPTAPASELTPFESSLYGYSIEYPTGWAVTEATRRLVGMEAPWVDGDAVDQFKAPFGGVSRNAVVVVARAEVPPGSTLDEWTQNVASATCGTESAREVVAIDGVAANVLTFARCNGYFHIWATVLRGTSLYHIVWLNFTGTEAADRALFDRMLGTVDLAFEVQGPGSIAPSP